MEIIRLPDPDYGLAVRTGMRKAGGQGWLVLFDIDYYSGMFISDIMKATDEYDVILASKRVAGSQDQRPWLAPCNHMGIQRYIACIYQIYFD